MADSRLSDREAKNILLSWPSRTNSHWSTPRKEGYWIQAQPKEAGSRRATPSVRVPGATLFKTQPDGMWVYLAGNSFADIACIEVCGTAQNLNDKRSRYSAAVRSLEIHCPLPWLNADISIQKGRQLPRWRACETIENEPTEDLSLPVRYARVLYALPNDLYRTWTQHNVPGGHEYFCRHSSLDSYNSPKMQSFLRQMSFASHFLTQAGS